MVEIGPGKLAAGRAAATGVQWRRIFGETGVLEV
jgi:hypothetical protein